MEEKQTTGTFSLLYAPTQVPFSLFPFLFVSAKHLFPTPLPSLRILAQFPDLDVHAALGTRRGRLLREACRRGLTKPAQELLERGAEVDAPDECGDAALTRAAMNERYTTVELLLRWEANAARVGRDGKTADEWCAHVGHAHLAARLAQAARYATVKSAGPASSISARPGTTMLPSACCRTSSCCLLSGLCASLSNRSQIFSL